MPALGKNFSIQRNTTMDDEINRRRANLIALLSDSCRSEISRLGPNPAILGLTHYRVGGLDVRIPFVGRPKRPPPEDAAELVPA